ncbi:MAG: histidinol-phosphatase [Clostridia bacterium]|nr:histidinol-phosphatase [Clostridia bacterium]
MILRDLHIHTNFCDGKKEPEEYVQASIEKGLSSIGFSVHSYVPFDPDCCIAKEQIPEYKARIGELKKKYEDRIGILCGVEQDYYSEESTDGYDYVIGSNHYFKTPGGEFLPLDLSFEVLETICDKYFYGDYLALCEDYYRVEADIPKKHRCNIIGHFDLITKFNEKFPRIDVTDERYIKAYTDAVKVLVPYNIPFEINMGAITRNYKALPYPSEEILRTIVKYGGKFILSSDAHSPCDVAFEFKKYEKWALENGAVLV